MRFSVIMPVHNVGPYLREALDGIKSQTLAPIEIIIIDDASSDDLMAQVGTSGLAVQTFRTEARNAAVARNLGIMEANGDWLAFLDADDIWQPEHLARAAELLTGSNAVGLLAHHVWRRAGIDESLPPSLRCDLAKPDAALPASCFPRRCSPVFTSGIPLECCRAVAIWRFTLSMKAVGGAMKSTCGCAPSQVTRGLGVPKCRPHTASIIQTVFPGPKSSAKSPTWMYCCTMSRSMIV